MSLLLKLKSLLPGRRRAMEQDMREELESLAGLSDADGARTDLGSLTYVAEESRALWTWTSVEAIAQDFKHALYALRRRPSLTVVAILTVGLAVGASTAIFSIVNAILIQPPPYHDADRLAMLWNLNERVGYTFDDVTSRRGESMSPAEFLEWKTNANIFDGMAAFDTRSYVITGTDQPEIVLGYVLAEGSFQTLGIQPLFGRLPTPQEERSAASHVVLLRYDLWQRRYHGDPAVIGQTMQFAGVDHRIIGVLPPQLGFFSRAFQFLGTLPFDERNLRDPYRGLRVMARLKQMTTFKEAQLRADQFSREMARRFPATNSNWHVRVISVKDDTSGKLQPAMVVLLAAVVSVLLIMCANIANLLLAQGAHRAREFAVRAALGARRARLIRQSLTESLLLSLTGGALGLIVAFGIVEYIQFLVPQRHRNMRFLLQADAIAVDWSVVAFALGTAVLTGLIFGALPALRASTPNLTEDLKDSCRGSNGPRGTTIRQGLVVAQVAVGLVLVIGAVLLVRSFAALYGSGPGFRSQGLLAIYVALPVNDFLRDLREQGLSEPEVGRAFRSRVQSINGTLLTDLAAVPGVRQVAATSSGLNIGGWFEPAAFSIEDRPVEPSIGSPMATRDVVTTNFFSTMGIPLLRGRGFTTMDDPSSVIINDALARRYFPTDDPIGKRIKPGPPASRFRWLTIVGVVGSIRQGGMDKAAGPTYYFNNPALLSESTIVLQTDGKPTALLPQVRQIVQRLHPGIPDVEGRDMTTVVRDSTWQLNYSMLLLSGLAGLALLLTVIGVYGILQYSISERTQEIGIRMALGADSKNIMGLVLRQGLVLVGVGTAVGLFAAMGLTRFMAALLFGVTPFDGPTFGLSAAILIAVGALAAYLPARRATRIEPIEALRHH